MKPSPTDTVEKMPIDALIPYARNSRTHSDEQVAQIAASIKEWGFTTPVLVDEDGGIIAGHGRTLAARKLGMTEVPVLVARGWTDAQKRAYVIADNKLALNAGWDQDLLNLELEELEASGFNIELTGFDANEINDLMQEISAKQNEPYTAKIKAPTYEPSPNKPELKDLVDTSKTTQLAEKINKANITNEERDFLLLAAQRHNIFDFRKIADFYSNASLEMQALMEDSALVIIDFKKAIENGFVQLSAKIEAQYLEDYEE